MANGWRVLAVGLAMFGLLGLSVSAQPPLPVPDAGPPVPDRPRLNLLDELGGNLFPGGDAGAKLTLSGEFEIEEGTSRGRLNVTAIPAPGWHFYSMQTPKGGPIPSTLKLAASDDYRLLGPFTPDAPPLSKVSSEFFADPLTRKKPLTVEEHHQTVVWTAPIELAAGVDPQALRIPIDYSGMVCDQSCMPIDEKFTATFGGFYRPPFVAQPFVAESQHVTWTAHAEPQIAAPGSRVQLVFTGQPTEPYHLYAYEPSNLKKGYAPTLIALRPLPAGWRQWPATTDRPVVAKPPAVEGLSEIRYHEGAVTWTVELAIPTNAEPGEVTLGGYLGFQTCTDTTCDMPQGAEFQIPLQIAEESVAGPAAAAFAPATYAAAETLALANAPTLETPLPAQGAEFGLIPLLIAMSLALLGGLILNAMPCVLPVIPLKLLSIVEQAGQSQAKLLAYNLVYAAGTIAVFLVLAAVGIAFGLGWGEQFAITEFQIIVALFLFAMILSLLGLWEIPLPGAVGSGETVSREDAGSLTAAFWKGFMTTIYATPCSGPFLGVAMGATLSFPWYATLLVFLAAGLGFASPYIVFGLMMVRFPSVTRFIPKPGVWMEHMKQGLGFLLLVVVLYYFCLIDLDYRVATLFAAIGVAFGCWLIGKVPPYAETRSKLLAWSGAGVSIGLASWFAFSYMGPLGEEADLLPWQPYSAQALAEARSQGKTVMVDFTASWCPNCHFNYRTAINTHAVQEVVERNNVVTLLADWSDRGSEIKDKLLELQSNTIPLLVVYPADGGQPIVMRDIVVQSQVVGALEKAGPSRIQDESPTGESPGDEPIAAMPVVR
jgi:suppressor for copper-sensitivity B